MGKLKKNLSRQPRLPLNFPQFGERVAEAAILIRNWFNSLGSI